VSYTQKDSIDLSGKAVLSPTGLTESPTVNSVTLDESVDKWRALNVTVAVYVNPVCRMRNYSV